MALVDDVKTSLRITSTAFNDEIQSLIDACLLDLEYSGLVNISQTDDLIVQAVKTYCKANFGLENKDSEKYDKSYQLQVSKMKLIPEYIESET
jgi:hypothetical protein